MEDLNARYVKIARDIAEKIVSGEFPEGSILKGRSLLASLYNVSPETIRKAVQLLANEKILFVKHGVGVFIDSRSKANKYLDSLGNKTNLNKKSDRIQDLLNKSKQIQEELSLEVQELMDDYKFQMSESISFSEIDIKDDSWIINKTLGEVYFWNYTEATVVAIKRKSKELITSPGPDIPLFAQDTIIFVGKDNLSYERVVAFLKYGIEE